MISFLRYRLSLLSILLILLTGLISWQHFFMQSQHKVQSEKTEEKYWFVLYRQSEKEELYLGIPGDKKSSELVRTFTVKTGRPGERPTPLPQLAGKEYWLITAKEYVPDNPETAPYFLTLNIPGIEEPPFGPVPYEECNGKQCDWILPGAFGLHGVAGNPEKLSESDTGSSGCIRHTDEDITYLYNLLDPTSEEIRYYIEDK